MKYHFIVGIMTLLTGLVLVVLGTDYGSKINVTVGLIMGSVMILLGIARIKNAIQMRHEREKE